MRAVELGGLPLTLIVAIGFISGIAGVWFVRRFSDSAKIRQAIGFILARLFEFRLFADEPSVILRAQWRLLAANANLLRLMAVPTAVLLVPYWLLFVTSEAYFGRVALRAGESTVVTLQCRNARPTLAEVQLVPPPGMAVETPAVRSAVDAQVSWRVKAIKAVSGQLQVQANGRTITKTISSRSGLQSTSEVRAGTVSAFLASPLELPFSDPAIASIGLRYPPARVFGLHWLVWMSLGSIAGALLGTKLRMPAFAIMSLALLSLSQGTLRADTASPLFARGYTVMPEPQRVTLTGKDFELAGSWKLQLGPGVSPDSAAVESLEALSLNLTTSAPLTLSLEIVQSAVTPGVTHDLERKAIAEQAYKIELARSRIRIAGNTGAGLFYGVQTLLQLVKRHGGAQWLPEGEIVDWPDLQLRQIYWDDAHHLERLPELKRAIRQAAYFKINGFVIKLEGHFQFRHAPPLVEPQALSPAEFQDLTDYGLRYHVQVIPYLDAPAHIAFILKHPEYAGLRAFIGSNYEMCVTNPDALKLMFAMYDDLLAANKGVNYFYLSTDEAYYVGLSSQDGCAEAARAQQLGSVGKVLAEFVTKAAGYLHDRGRSVVFWGEYPLKPDDIAALPNYVINGETYGEKFDALYKAHGIRQMIYSSTEGEERLFPHYFLRPPAQRMHELYEDYERIPAALSQISNDPALTSGNISGLVIAGWGDMGLHPETFWLGYAAITSAGWKMWTAGAREAATTFYPLFYGASVSDMDLVYRLMSYQSEVWSDTWDTVDSSARKPIWGNSERIFQPPQPARDQTLQIPAVPSPELRYAAGWSRDHAALLQMAAGALPENDRLQGLIGANLRLADQNRYNLQVFLSIAILCRQNLDMIGAFGRIDDDLVKGDRMAASGKSREAIAAVDQALAEARAIRTARNAAFSDTLGTWYKSWLPRVEQANGRRFLHQVDDVKDHLPDRTVDMTYLIYRELQLPLNAWYVGVEAARNHFAAAHGLPEQNRPLDWAGVQ